MNSAEKNIELAVSLCRKNFSIDEIEEILRGQDDVKKCISIMNLKKITSTKFADLLLFHLTGHGGTVREAVAIKLASLLENAENYKFFQSDYSVNTICNAIIDINPNISRLILDILNKIENKDLLMNNIFLMLIDALENILNCGVLQNHQVNKYYFKLYWLLEALYRLDNLSVEKFKILLEKISELSEYTVREKVAQLVKKYEKQLFSLKRKLLNDENYYVRRIFE